MMNYVDSLKLFGVAAKEIPCIKGSGAPTTATDGAVGCLYMNTDSGELYKCTAVADGLYTWEIINSNNGVGSAEGAVLYNAPQSLSDDQKAQARENMGAAENKTHIVNVAFRAGTISGTNGAHTDSSPKRGRSDFLSAGDVLRIEADSDYKIYVHCYDDTMTYCGNTKGAAISTDGWVQEVDISALRAKYEALSYVRVSLKRNDNANLSETLGDVYGKVRLVKSKASAIEYESFGLPCVYLMGDVSQMSKDNTVEMDAKYFDNFTPAAGSTIANEHTGKCTVKWQGGSSVRRGYPKRNYTVKFAEAVQFFDTWGAQKKYCLKANWIDPSAMRNIVCARLWARCVGNRLYKADPENYKSTLLYNAPNRGAVDGVPIILYINGEFEGLYTLNIPKDKWLFNMGSGTNEYLVGSESNGCASCGFLAAPTFAGDEVKQTLDFAVEEMSDGVEESTVIASFQTMANAIKNAPDSAQWEAAVEPYFDVSSAIDYLIFTCCIGAYDNTRKNILYATYDGTKWFMSAYDMDATFGMGVYGSNMYNVNNDRNTFANIAKSSWNRLFYLIYTYSRQKLVDRYDAIRANVLSDEVMWENLTNFALGVPRVAYDADAKRWPTMPQTTVANVHGYMDYFRMHCAYLDKEIAELEATLETNVPTEQPDTPELITFMITGDAIGALQYSAESGVTWADWVNSIYNTDGFLFDKITGLVTTADGVNVHAWENDPENPAVSAGSEIYGDGVITDGGQYWVY